MIRMRVRAGKITAVDTARYIVNSIRVALGLEFCSQGWDQIRGCVTVGVPVIFSDEVMTL